MIVRRYIGLPENEMGIIESEDMLIHNIITPELKEKDQQITQLTNNWNELEEWLKEYYMSNERWYKEQLSDSDKKYYQKDYDIIAYMLKRFLGKMKQIKDGNNEK